MAESEFKPAGTFSQTVAEDGKNTATFHELFRKKNVYRLHDATPVSATFHTRTAAKGETAVCGELYSRIRYHHIELRGEWLVAAGFIEGMPVKIRVMPDCIVITPQHTRELWGCIEGMSVTFINQRNVNLWMEKFPGALHNTGDIPVHRRKP